MRIKLIFSLAFSIFLLGCNNAVNKEEISTQESVVEEEHHHDEQEAIVLDNGKKWVVVTEMMAFIKNIENEVVDLSKNENPTFENYQTLSATIEKNLDELTSNCTMTGQAHDELHKWLVPFLDLSAEFVEVKNEEEAKAVYQKIKESFNEFNTYFE
jgi:TolA-binding protein